MIRPVALRRSRRKVGLARFAHRHVAPRVVPSGESARDDLDAAAGEAEQAVGLGPFEHPVRRRPGRPGHGGEVVLGEPDDDPVLLSELVGDGEEPAQHPGVGRHEHRFDGELGEPPHLGGEQLDEKPLDLRVIATQLLELAVFDDARIGRADRDCGRAASFVAVEECELSEGGAGAEHRERRDVAEPGPDADGDVAAFDQIHRVTPVAFVEDHLTGRELASACCARRRRRSSSPRTSSSPRSLTRQT